MNLFLLNIYLSPKQKYLSLSLFVLMFLFNVEVKAQVSTYTFTQSTGTFTEITGGTILATATGNGVGNPSIDDMNFTLTGFPFTFTFNGVGYTGCTVNSNGYITFGVTAPATNLYTPISGTTAYAGAIAAWGGDMNAIFNLGGRTGELRWQAVGTAPNQEIVIQWKNFRPAYSTSATNAAYLNFQIRLQQNGNKVVIIHGVSGMAIGSTNISTTKQIGLRGSANTDFNNRANTTAQLFGASTVGTANTSVQSFSSVTATPGRPANGLSYTWTPPAPPACAAPTAITATSITSTSATLNWTAPSPAPSSGYQWEVRTSGAAGSGATGLAANGSTAAGVVTANVTGLTANTTYSIYVRSNCGGSGFSAWTSAVTFFTGYCTASATSTSFEKISNISFNTINNSSTSTAGYEDFTGVSTTVSTSNSYTFTATISGGYATDQILVWVDWNEDLDFVDAGEAVYTSAQGVGPHSTSITIPAGASAGNKRMRVRLHDVSDGANSTPCGTSTYGQVEDYILAVITAVPCTGTPTAGTAAASPTNLCTAGTTNLSLTGYTTGFSGISFQWQSSPNNSTWTSIGGATAATYTASVSAMTYFRCVVTCTNSGLSANSSSVQVTFGTPLGATFASPIAVGTLGCTPYSSTLNNATVNCYGNDLTVGTNQTSDDIFYQFVLSNANNFSTIVNMGHCGSGFDTYIHLLNSAGALIVENDDGGPICTGTSSSLQQTLATGTYYVVSEGYGTGTGNIITAISIPAVTGTGSVAGSAAICLPTTGVTYTISGYTNATGYLWTVPSGATITAGQGTATITVSFAAGASSGNITCTPYNGPCVGTATNYAITTYTPAGNPATIPTGQWNVYCYNAGDATGGSGAWTSNYTGYYPITSLDFNTQTLAPTWLSSASPSSAAGYLGCPVNADNHSYIFKRQGVPTCGSYRIDVAGHDDAAILYINGVEVWRHVTNCCDAHTGIWTGYLDASSTIEYYISEGGGGSNADMTFTLLTGLGGTVTGSNPTTCGGNGSIAISNPVGGNCNITSSGFGAAPSGTTVYGAAAITGEECVLTTAAASLLGTWGITPTIRPDYWEITYQQYIGGGSGADGMSFSYGGFNPSTGGGETGFGTGLSISFDTHNGATNSQLWIYYDGAVVTNNAVNAVNLRTGTYVPVTITVNGNNQVTVVWNGTTIFSNVALPAGYAAANKSAWNFAFSARTGGATDIHKIDNVNLYSIGYAEYSINGTTWQQSPIAAAAGSYTVQARYRCGTSCVNTNIGTVTLTNPSLPTITLGAVASVCSGATTISLPYSATTNSPNQYSITTGTPVMSGFAVVTNASLPASPIGITIPSNAAANTYQFNLTVTNSITACTSASQVFSVTVASAPTLTTPSPTSATFCPGGSAANFSTTGSGGTGTGAAYQWQYSTGGAYTNFTNGSGNAPYYNTCSNTTTSTASITPFVSAGTGFSIRCIYSTTGTACSVTSSVVNITYNTASSNPTSATVSNSAVCSGTNINLTLNGGGGGTGALVKWYSTACGTTLVGTGSPLTVAPTSNTTYYGRYEGTCNTTLCASVAVAVTPAPVLSSSFVSPLCNGNTNGSINLTVSGLTPSITFDGNINEAVWSTALATSTGGATAGFGAGHEVNALYATADETYSYFAIAGNVQTNNRILLFLDTKTGGYNTANFDRTAAPAGINNFNSGTTFDAGFLPDYCLVIGTNGSGTYYYDLFTLAATGANNFLGTNGATGLGASPANSNMTQGFEIRIPNTALGYVGGGMKAFAAYISDGGFLSNQFLTKANSGEGNYGSGAVTFGAAAPNPLTSPNLTYAWSNSATTQDLANIAAGTYTVTVTSANGCTANTSVTVTQPTALVGNSCVTASDLCQAGTGAVKVVASGGTPPYTVARTPVLGTFSPSNSIATSGGNTLIINLNGGSTLNITITDANGCQTP